MTNDGFGHPIRRTQSSDKLNNRTSENQLQRRPSLDQMQSMRFEEAKKSLKEALNSVDVEEIFKQVEEHKLMDILPKHLTEKYKKALELLEYRGVSQIDNLNQSAADI